MTNEKKYEPIAFCKCEERIFKIKQGENIGKTFSNFQGNLNINGKWYTVKLKPTRSGDMMCEIHKQKGGENESN